MAKDFSKQVMNRRGEGFGTGYTAITHEDSGGTGVDFGILKMRSGENLSETSSKETAFVLLKGRARGGADTAGKELHRSSLFDEAPSAMHGSAGTLFTIDAVTDCEWAVARTSNTARFDARIYGPKDVEFEWRGKGLVQNTCLRNVRCIFDDRTRPEANLVIGEVINFPGRWSSYPPHHHDQPEIYHYRFTLPQGYGHAELGDSVFKVKEGDTVTILGGEDHSQVSAPGYGMYYLWVVRHLDGNRYRGFTFTEEHKWLLDAKNQGWMPPEEAFK